MSCARSHALQVHREPLEAVGQLDRDRVELDAAGLLEVGELGDLHPVHPHLPAEPPGPQAWGSPSCPRRTGRRGRAASIPIARKRAQVEVLDVVGRRLQDHLVLVVLLEPEGVLAVAAVVGPDRRLDVAGAPRLRAEHAQERGRVRGARADLGVVRLHDRAALLLPVGLEGAIIPWKVSAAIGASKLSGRAATAPSCAQCAQLEAAVVLVGALQHTQRVAGRAQSGTRLAQRPGRAAARSLPDSRLDRERARRTQAVSHTAPPAAGE